MEFVFKKENDSFKTVGVTIPTSEETEEGILISCEFFATIEDPFFIRFYEEKIENCFVKEDDVYIFNGFRYIKYDLPFLKLGVYLIKKEDNKRIFIKLRKKQKN